MYYPAPEQRATIPRSLNINRFFESHTPVILDILFRLDFFSLIALRHLVHLSLLFWRSYRTRTSHNDFKSQWVLSQIIIVQRMVSVEKEMNLGAMTINNHQKEFSEIKLCLILLLSPASDRRGGLVVGASAS